MRSEQYRDETEAKPSRLRQVISLAFIAVGCFFGYRAISSEPVASEASRQVMPPAATAPKYHTSNIEDLRVGDWVLSGNPEVTDHERETFEEVDPGSWRKLDLRMEKRDGGRLDLVLLRPVEWVNSVGAKAGGKIHLDLPELGAEGNARIVSIGPSPDIGPAPSTACQLVTGTFAHSSGEILDIRVEGLDEPIGVTANHPFYSEDAKTFVPAGKLSPGELLRQANGRSSRVIQITKRTTPEPVFNLEVNGEHTYHISKTALLVHNNSAAGYKGISPKRLSGNRKALHDLAKEAKIRGRTKPISLEEAKTLQEWASEYGVKYRPKTPGKVEIHPNRNFDKPHIHIDNVDHIPVEP